VRTVDVADIADVIFLAKATVHTRMVTDDNIIVDEGDPGPGQCAYGNVIARRCAVLERLITNGCVVVSAGVPGKGKTTKSYIVVCINVGSERFPTDARVRAASDIVHERKVTGRSISVTADVTAAVKKEGISPNGRVLCPPDVEQQGC
jgi:hypothetical protein